jgi:hypothetical protein
MSSCSVGLALVRRATEFRELRRAKRIARREPERSEGIKAAVEAALPSRRPVPEGQIPSQEKAT